jgi:hypothetical protein
LTAASHAPRSDLRAAVFDSRDSRQRGPGPVSADAGKLSGRLGTGDAGAGGDTLGGFVLAGVGLASFGMKEKPSAPLLRLAYIHLLASLSTYRSLNDRVTAVLRVVNEI